MFMSGASVQEEVVLSTEYYGEKIDGEIIKRFRYSRPRVKRKLKYFNPNCMRVAKTSMPGDYCGLQRCIDPPGTANDPLIESADLNISFCPHHIIVLGERG